MDQSSSDTARPRRLQGADKRLLRGYGPLAVAAVGLVAMIVLVPSKAPETAATAEVVEGIEAETATGWGDTVDGCEGGGPQVEGDPYSPPCFTFSGDNGGETSRGVTADTIKVSYRQTSDPDTLSVLATLMGIPFDDTPQDFVRTMQGLVEYFNENFQLYGRSIELVPYEGRGSLVEELVGAGQETAGADALQAGVEIGAFADITATTQPYAEALVQQDVIAFGAPYMSREWFLDRRPYAWSYTTDCSRVAEASSTYGLRRLIGQPAIHAGGDMEGETRRMAVIAPSNAEYQQCARAGLQVVEDAGEEIDLVTDYVLDLARIPPQAKSIAAQLVTEDITTISFFGDPYMLLNLTQEMESQGRQPEWIVPGTGFSDLDLIGQGLANKNDQWTRAFGASPLAEQEPEGESAGYLAYSSVRDDEPAITVDVIYYQLYQLVIGIQMAGPDLNPRTFETGMFAYPEASGPGGTWDYQPDSYTPVVDLREVWWDPDKTSPFNGAKGSYASTDERFVPDDLPEGEQPAVFGQ